MIEKGKDYIIKGISCIIFIVAVYLPNDMYLLKAVGLIIFTIVLFKDNIKSLLAKRNR
jgi:hypothetical protein